MSQEIKTEVIYVGHNINQWLVKDYVISENRGDWFCSCAIKYSRNPKRKCKHITIVQNFLLSDEQKELLRIRQQKREMLNKLKAIDLKACKHHIFNAMKEKGEQFYYCDKCQSKLNLEEYKFYRKVNNLN